MGRDKAAAPVLLFGGGAATKVVAPAQGCRSFWAIEQNLNNSSCPDRPGGGRFPARAFVSWIPWETLSLTLSQSARRIFRFAPNFHTACVWARGVWAEMPVCVVAGFGKPASRGAFSVIRPNAAAGFGSRTTTLINGELARWPPNHPGRSLQEAPKKGLSLGPQIIDASNTSKYRNKSRFFRQQFLFRRQHFHLHLPQHSGQRQHRRKRASFMPTVIGYFDMRCSNISFAERRIQGHPLPLHPDFGPHVETHLRTHVVNVDHPNG